MRHSDWNLNNDLKGESMFLVVAAKDFWLGVNVDDDIYDLEPRWCAW